MAYVEVVVAHYYVMQLRMLRFVCIVVDTIAEDTRLQKRYVTGVCRDISCETLPTCI